MDMTIARPYSVSAGSSPGSGSMSAGSASVPWPPPSNSTSTSTLAPPSAPASAPGPPLAPGHGPELTASGAVRRKRVRTVTGCLVCRRRRVKCDEARPRCRNCSKHPDRVCEYQYPAEAHDSAAFPPYPPMQPTPPRPPPPPPPHPPPASHPTPLQSYTAAIPQIGPIPSTHTPIPLQQQIPPSPYDQLAHQVQQIQYTQQLEQARQQEEARKAESKPLLPSTPADPSFYPPYDPSFYPPCDPSFYPPPAGSGGPAYADQFARTQASALAAESRSLPFPTGGADALASVLLSNLPIAKSSPLSELIRQVQHEEILRRSIIDMQTGDPESRLLCTATAYISGGSGGIPGADGRDMRDTSQALMREYIDLVRREAQSGPSPANASPNEPVTGKLAAAGFTLFLSQILYASPGMWKEQLSAGVAWAEARGGPGWVMGVSPPRPGFAGREPVNLAPLAMAVYSDMTALLTVLSSLSNGTVPSYITSDPSWLVASRALQLRLSPGIPDLFEAVAATPRITIPVFARAVALVSRRITATSSELAPDMVLESLEFDAAALRTEIESAWPARLVSRPDTRRMQYGARIWTAAALVLTIHAAQGMPANNPDVQAKVDVFFNMCSDAVADLGDLNGWMWPIVVVACAATGDRRRQYRDLVQMARSTVVEKDNTLMAVQLLEHVHRAHDRGQRNYHIFQAIQDHPDLDVLIL